MRLDLTRTPRYSSKPRERFADQKLLLRANGHQTSQAMQGYTNCESKTRWGGAGGGIDRDGLLGRRSDAGGIAGGGSDSRRMRSRAASQPWRGVSAGWDGALRMSSLARPIAASQLCRLFPGRCDRGG